MKSAGLSLLGKTNTDEFAMGSSTENSAWGPSRNPWDPSRVPGGSGGGSAAAVTAGPCRGHSAPTRAAPSSSPPRSAGTSASARRTAARLVSRYGVVAFASSLDQVGPVAKTVQDVALLYSVIAGRDPQDSTTARLPEPVRLPEGDSLAGVRIGVDRAQRGGGDRARVREAVIRALSLAEGLGATVEECSLPRSVRYGLPCYYLIAPAEASSNLARYDGVRYGPRAQGSSYQETVDRTRDEGFGDEPKRRIMLGTYALSAGYYDAFYGQAQKVRTLIIEEHREALSRFDLACPTSPTVAFEIGERAADPLAMCADDLLTIRPAWPGCRASRSRAGSRKGSRSGCS